VLWAPTFWEHQDILRPVSFVRKRHTYIILSEIKVNSDYAIWDNGAASLKPSGVNSPFSHVEMIGDVKLTVVRTRRRHFIVYSSAKFRRDSTWSSHSSWHNYWLWRHCCLVSSVTTVFSTKWHCLCGYESWDSPSYERILYQICNVENNLTYEAVKWYIQGLGYCQGLYTRVTETLRQKVFP
jgi:hypothetical protein